MTCSIHRLLFAPDSGVAAPPVAPNAATPPASSTPPAAPATPVPVSDDPFEPPKKPSPATPPAAPAAGAKPATPAAAPAGVASDIDRLAPKELRERVKQLNEEKRTYSEKVANLEAKIKEAEGRGADTSALTTRLTAIEKERDSALAELRAARQEASPEFKEKYDKPFNQAAERAKEQFSQLTITDPETGTPRPAKWETDFAAIYGLPLGKAIEQANTVFGQSAQFVLGLREKLLDMNNARMVALKEEKEQFKERTAKDIAEQAVRRETVGKLWGETNKRLSESVEDYKVDTTDAEATDARKHALDVFDAQIQSANQDDFVTKKVLKDAHIRQKVGAYAVQKLQITRLKTENDTLKKQIAELKGTAPGGVQRPGGDAPAAEGDEEWGAGLKKAVTG